jgi:sulfatase maturation enzyme AslB (radical SAM superfamily)
MANLVVTDICNMKCSFCFAHDYLQKSRFISLEAFEQQLDFIDRSDIQEIRMIGGEPSLHPRFPELIARAQERGKHILVFSHGLLSEGALSALEALPAEQCTILINMNATRTPGQKNIKEENQRLITLRRLGLRALLGFNIYEASPHFDFLVPLILDTNCRRAIRLGLAHPILEGQNAYLHPKQYPLVGSKIAQFAKSAAKFDIRVELDCGFVRCMFSDEDLETLIQAQADVGWRCNPILDIDLTEQVFHCFPLSARVHRPFLQDTTAADLRMLLAEQTRAYRAVGIYKECSTCLFRQKNECMGGCLANTMKRFHPAVLRLRVPDYLVADRP